MDAMLAATAQRERACLATINRRHFPMLEDLLVPY
jgi:predicted nucleic acid-binding protein